MHRSTPPTPEVRPRALDRLLRPLLRSVATGHAVLAFGQPVFAGSYLTGNMLGWQLHAGGADLVFTLGLIQAMIAAVITVRTRRAWPLVVSAGVVAAETAQYFAGLAGALWLHIPLGVAIVAGVVATAVATWVAPLSPRRTAVRRPGRSRTRLGTADG